MVTQAWRPNTSPCLLIVAAPIKRSYIWDLAPSVSAATADRFGSARVGSKPFAVSRTLRCEAKNRTGIGPHPETRKSAVIPIAETGYVRRSEFTLLPAPAWLRRAQLLELI